MKILRAYSGDGIYWMITNLGAAYFAESVPSAKNMIATSMISQALGKNVVLRFAGEDVVCAAMGTRPDVKGMWSAGN